MNAFEGFTYYLGQFAVFVAAVAFSIAASRRPTFKMLALAAAFIFATVPSLGYFFPVTFTDLETGAVTLRPFYYVSRVSIALYLSLVASAAIAFARETISQAKKPNQPPQTTPVSAPR